MDFALRRARTARRRRAQRVLAVVAVAGSLVATATYWLGSTGATSTDITAPSGLTNGRIADVTAMSSNVSQNNGGAVKLTGKTIGKVLIAKDYTQNVRIAAAWLNPLDAQQVLGNPHAQIRISLYYPVSTTTTPCSSGQNPFLIVDGGTTFCAVEDGAATGSYTVNESGQLFLADTILTGYLRPSVDASGTLGGCAAASSSSTTWCQPTVSYATASQRLVYIVASIIVGTRDNAPPGQQGLIGGLNFYLRTSRIG